MKYLYQLVKLKQNNGKRMGEKDRRDKDKYISGHTYE